MINRIELEIISSLNKFLAVAMLQSNEDGIRYMNNSAMELFGFSNQDELLYFPRKQIFANPDVYHETVYRLETVGTIYRERVLFVTKDKVQFWGSLYSVRKSVGDQQVNDEIILDISTEVKMEHLIVEKDHLLNKVRGELDRFIYSASHDLRAPISSLNGLINLMKINSKEAHDPYVIMMEKTLSKLELHIEKLTDFARINNESIEWKKIDVEQIFIHLQGELKTHQNYDKAILTIKSFGDHVFFSDATKIQTCLIQLLNNAYDYIDMNKMTAYININIFYCSDSLKLEIADNGIGIKEEQIGHIFSLFYRGTELSSGSGLGLYLVKQALDRIHGEIQVDSMPNKGTTIFINIPNQK